MVAIAEMAGSRVEFGEIGCQNGPASLAQHESEGEGHDLESLAVEGG